MAEQQVTAPDQHKPANLKWARIVGVASIIMLLVMLRPFNNHDGGVEDVFLLLTAGLVAAMMVGDAALRRLGLRP